MLKRKAYLYIVRSVTILRHNHCTSRLLCVMTVCVCIPGVGGGVRLEQQLALSRSREVSGERATSASERERTHTHRHTHSPYARWQISQKPYRYQYTVRTERSTGRWVVDVEAHFTGMYTRLGRRLWSPHGRSVVHAAKKTVEDISSVVVKRRLLCASRTRSTHAKKCQKWKSESIKICT